MFQYEPSWGYDPSFYNCKWPRVTSGFVDGYGGFQRSDSSADGIVLMYSTKETRQLTLRDQEAVYSALVRVTSDSFGADMTEYWRSQYRSGFLERAEIVMLAVEEATFDVAGWSAAHVLNLDKDHRFVYMDSTGVRRSLQGSGLVTRWWRSEEIHSILHSGERSTYLTARTESPIVHRMLRKFVKELYPIDSSSPPEDIRQVSAAVAGWLGQASIFDSRTLRLVGAYENLNELYDELPSSGDLQIDQIYRNGQLGPLDAYIVCGMVE